MPDQKTRIIDVIESFRPELTQLALDIHAHPELGYEEVQSSGFICDLLEKHGFTVTRGYCDMATSFRADRQGRGPGPCVAFLAEYDALPGCSPDGKGVGHGCGHNLISTCSVAAFLGLTALADQFDGTVSIIGTPAEEGGAGKVHLLDRGAFDDVDFALMMHPSSGGVPGNLVGRGARASTGVIAEFTGRGCHSSAPQNGINALTSCISLFNQIDAMRPTFELSDNINGIITDGGQASNIIPAFASAKFTVRADTMKRCGELVEIMRGCAERAAAMTGATLAFKNGVITAERYPNKPMNQAFKDNMAKLGIEMVWPDPRKQYGSSDIGNVSIKIPAIHDYLSIDDTAAAHTPAYCVASATPYAIDVAIKGGMGLAMTGWDILSDEAFRQEIKAYHDQQIPDFYKNKQ